MVVKIQHQKFQPINENARQYYVSCELNEFDLNFNFQSFLATLAT